MSTRAFVPLLFISTLNSRGGVGSTASPNAHSQPPSEWLDPNATTPPTFQYTWMDRDLVCSSSHGTGCIPETRFQASPWCEGMCSPWYLGRWCRDLGKPCAYPHKVLVAKSNKAPVQIPPPFHMDLVEGPINTCMSNFMSEGKLQVVHINDSIGRQLLFQLLRWLSCGNVVPDWVEITGEGTHQPWMAFNSSKSIPNRTECIAAGAMPLSESILALERARASRHKKHSKHHQHVLPPTPKVLSSSPLRATLPNLPQTMFATKEDSTYQETHSNAGVQHDHSTPPPLRHQTCVTCPHPETDRLEAKQLRMCLLSKRELRY